MNKVTALLLASALTTLVAGTAPAVSGAADAAATKPAPAAAPVQAAPTAAPAVTPAPATAAPAATEAKEQGCKFGYVDMTQVAEETERGKAATAQLKTKSEKLTAKIKAKQNQLEKQKEAIQAKLETLSPKERAAKSKEFQKKVEEYQKLVRSSDEDMAQMQEKLTTELFQVIKKAAGEYAKSHGYAAVLTKKELLYMADVPAPKNLTDEIVEMLNKKADTK